MNDRLATLLRHLAIGTLTGMFAGAIAGGVGSRIAMRITALMTDDRLQGRLTEAQARVGEITASGTFFLIFLAALFGAYGGLLYRAAGAWLPASTWIKGLVFGLLLLLLHGTVIVEGDNFDFERFGSVTVNLTMFILIPIIFGLISAYTDAWLERKYPPFAFQNKPLLLHLPAILGVVILGLVILGAVDSLTPNIDDGQLTSIEQGRLILGMVMVITTSLLFEPLIKRLHYALYIRAATLIIPALYGGMLLIEAIQQLRIRA